MKRFLFFISLLLVPFFFISAEGFTGEVGITIGKSSFESYMNSQLESIGFTEGDSNIALGGEIRLSYYNLRIDMSGEFTVINADFESRAVNRTLGKKFIFFNGMADFAVHFNFAQRYNIGLGLGPYALCILYDNSLADIYPEEYWQDKKSFFSSLITGNFNYRLSFDVSVADAFKVGFAYILPTNFNLSSFDVSDLVPFSPDVEEEGKITLCFLIQVF